MGVNLGSAVWLRRLGWASLVANIGIVLTGGAVRLTSSGLGCPTWPRCTEESFTPHGALDYHSAIEFGNRTLTFVLVAIAVATFVSAWQSGRRDLRRLALVLAVSIPAQAVIGGFTVLTDLNPWIVSFHLLVSLAIISAAVLYLWRIDRPSGAHVPAPFTPLAWATYGVAWAVLYLGTVVTGSGTHAGDLDSPATASTPSGSPSCTPTWCSSWSGSRSACSSGSACPAAHPVSGEPVHDAARCGDRPGDGRVRPVRHGSSRSCSWASTCSAQRWSSPR